MGWESVVGGSTLIWSVGRWVGGQWVDSNIVGRLVVRWLVVGESVEDVSVGWWSVVGGRWVGEGPVDGWWFCNTQPVKKKTHAKVLMEDMYAMLPLNYSQMPEYPLR